MPDPIRLVTSTLFHTNGNDIVNSPLPNLFCENEQVVALTNKMAMESIVFTRKNYLLNLTLDNDQLSISNETLIAEFFDQIARNLQLK